MRIIAQNGRSTSELRTALHQAKIAGYYDLFSLLIRANNQYRYLPIDLNRTESMEYPQAVQFTAGGAGCVFVVSIRE